jgi:hypothetical protein
MESRLPAQKGRVPHCLYHDELGEMTANGVAGLAIELYGGWKCLEPGCSGFWHRSTGYFLWPVISGTGESCPVHRLFMYASLQSAGKRTFLCPHDGCDKTTVTAR